MDFQATASESHGEVISWSSDFGQGNARDVQQRKDGTISFTISPDPGGDQYLWFFLKIAVDQSDSVDFVLMNAAKAHQTGNRWNITKPFISADGETWHRAIDIKYGKDSGLLNILNEPVFRFRSPIVSDTLWIAYFQPYTNKDLCSFITQLDTYESVRVSSLGLSEEGRKIPLITVAKLDSSNTERETIWIVGREHPGETPLSFVCEGIIEAILNHPAGKRLCTIFDFRVVPILNVDGVDHGHYYHNATGVNLARDWVDFKAVETRLLRNAIIEDIDNSQVSLLINLHSSNDPIRGHFFLEISPSALSNEDAELQRAIFSAADKQHPQIQSQSPVKLLDLPGITGNALYHNFGIYCLYLESNYSRGADGSLVTTESLKEVGMALVQTLAEVLIPE
jgi:murein tripeptide amidase MpaA